MAGQVLDRGPEFGVTGLIIEHNTATSLGEISAGVSNYDFSTVFGAMTSPCGGRGDRGQYREILAKAHRLGIEPMSCAPKCTFPRASGAVNLDDPALWAINR